MTDKSYEEGLREGLLKSLQGSIEIHDRRLDEHSRRITAQERITYALLGAIALIEILPTIQQAVSG